MPLLILWLILIGLTRWGAMQGEFAQYLPDWAYVPGVTPRHPEGWFSDLKDSFRTHTPLETFGDTLLFRVGLYYLDHGYFWECHEVVEPLWLAAPARSAERIFFQLIIQVANAGLKRKMGRMNAYSRLVGMAETLASDLRSRGVDAIYGIKLADIMYYTA